MKDIAYCNTQFKRFAKYFNGLVEKKQKYYIGFATETSENVWWYDEARLYSEASQVVSFFMRCKKIQT